MTLHQPTNPLSEALEAITGLTPPFALEGISEISQLEDTAMIALSDWCSGNARPYWATGESILDAAFLMIERAVENDNIDLFA